jgi:hypothetical protein
MTRSEKLTLTLLAAAGAVTLGVVPGASAANNQVQQAVSQNWSGYVASGTQFRSVSGSWVEPSSNCSSADGYAAFWVGLGGSGSGSGALEQTGTQSDCSSRQAIDYAWYELVPAGPVKLGLQIHPGDHISAKVSVNGSDVTIAMNDQTTRQSTVKTLQMDSPDTSSAEWIAEAPSSCDQTGSCTPLPLSDFGTVTFSDASATSADGHTGTISDPIWSAQPVQLSGNGTGAQFASTDSSAGAAPTSLSGDGSSFGVSWQSDGSGTVASGGGTGYPGYDGGGYGYPSSGYGGGYPGAGYGGGYGDGGGYPGSGYGYGYGYGGYGAAYGYSF